MVLQAPLLLSNQEDNPYSTTIKPLNLEWREPAEPWLYTAFWTLQVLDTYTTYRGLKYDCVEEVNPLLPSVPSLGQIAALKVAIYHPVYLSQNKPYYQNRDLVLANALSLAVVDNNYKVWKEVRNVCGRR